MGGNTSAKQAREWRRGPKASVDLDGDEIMQAKAEHEENMASEDEYWKEPQEIPEEIELERAQRRAATSPYHDCKFTFTNLMNLTNVPHKKRLFA